MTLSVVILNYNVRYFLELCLQSVIAATKDITSEIIVVDNASDDDSCAMVQSKFPEIILIQNKQNFGFSKGNNIGVSKAKGDYICVLNPDTMVAEDTFKILIEFAKTQKKIGAIGCKLIDGTGRFLPESKRNLPTPLVAFKKMLGWSKSYYAHHLTPNQSGKIDVLVGALMLMQREVYQAVKGFDEDFFMYGEDIDLSYRIQQAGYQNYYIGSTSILHFKGESTLKDKQYAQRFYGAMQLFYNKHFRSGLLLNIIVKLGVKLSTLQFSKSKEKQLRSLGYLIANHQQTQFQSNILQPQTIIENNNHLLKHHTLILDADNLSFKQIISDMERLSSQNIFFRIHPKKCQFLLGSDSANDRGAVVKF
jgi:GT2 family glycosyltransferase